MRKCTVWGCWLGHLLALLLVVSCGPVLWADTFRLKGGRLLRGELLKERADSYVADLGFDVVVIPKAAVEEHLRDEEAKEAGGPQGEPTPTSPEPAAEPGDEAEHLYSVTAQACRGMRETAQKFGPAVLVVRTARGLGSGFVIDEAGHVVTNAHVIQWETRISLTLFLGEAGKLERKKVERVRIVAMNSHLDLALLQAPELTELAVPHVFLPGTGPYGGESEALRVGQEVFAIGAPLGLERSASEGIVSTTARNMGGVLYVQTTAPVNPGNSGGPLFDVRGRVVGVINAKAFGAEGVGFAIPVFYVKHFLDHYQAFAYDKDNPNTGYHYLSPPGAISLEETSGTSGIPAEPSTGEPGED